ncbi:hypothetical protein ACFOW1_09670 [Parasediminibacterium paludis]|uniref:DUF4868 domain-containing protein n=1 Tax=Parasediminibacterium paludis TaxID=908966 RepID=A0ABV8PX76_9BACT
MATESKVKRKIHFYQLEFDYHEENTPTDGDKFREFFSAFSKLGKSGVRYQQYGNKRIFMQEVKFKADRKLITGKLLSVRTDLFPEFINFTTEEISGIDAEELKIDGIVDTVHFVIDYTKDIPVVAVEYNEFGARFNDFLQYVHKVGTFKKLINKLNYRPVVKNTLETIQERIKKCSEFIVKVHKSNIEQIRSGDLKTYTALKAALDEFDSEYATIVLKFDYQQRVETSEVNKSIFNLVKFLKDNPDKNRKLFNTLQVRSEDKNKNELLEDFDFLLDKEVADISVLKKKNYRSVVSADIFEKMQGQILKKNIQ